MYTFRKNIAAIAAYMIGVSDERLSNHYNETILTNLYNNKDATIIRFLNQFRTSLYVNYKNIDYEIRYNLKNINDIEWFDKEKVQTLEKWGISVIQINYTANKYCYHFSNLIETNINNCQTLFPDWVNFDYIKDLFIIPQKKNKDLVLSERTKFLTQKDLYPFQMYIHWKPCNVQNFLINDEHFLESLYMLHADSFHDKTKTRDVTEETKGDIYKYIESGKRVMIAVDCENSDVFKLYGVLQNLNAENHHKIEKIVLYDDYHTSTAWEWLSKYTKIPVEYHNVERIKDSKSLVDIKMTAGICEAFYQDMVDSFIIFSSDSDFWGLISSLPNARFLVMHEKTKCGQAIISALDSHKILHCSIDDFYTGNATNLKNNVLLNKLKEIAPNIIGMNGMEVAHRVYQETRIFSPENEIQKFYEKYIRTMRLKQDEKGIFYIDVLGY